MATHQIKFYPVGNADSCEIITSNGQRILFDYFQRGAGDTDDDPRIDLKLHLTDELKKAKRDDYDIVAFTHADRDHIQGSTEFFELQHAEKYQGNGRIKINELWVPAAMVIEEVAREELLDEFALWRKEARYRLLEGKGIKIFSQPEKLMEWLRPALKARGEAESSRDYLFVDAGTVVNDFTLERNGIEFFCHSPFIKHCDDGDVLRNESSLIFNIRLRAGDNDYDFLQVGDSTWEVLEEIVSISEFHGNQGRLCWNLFNVPHHCSYLALSDEKGATKTEPKPLVKKLLLYGQAQAYMLSSSKPIQNIAQMYSEVQPPHIQARKTYEDYLSKVGGRRFIVTMEEPNANKPMPVEFRITEGGVSWIRAITGAVAVATSAPTRAGFATEPVRAD